MKKIDLRDRGEVSRYLTWPVLGLVVGGLIFAVALIGKAPTSAAGILGVVIIVLSVLSICLETRATRGWRLIISSSGLTLINPRGVRTTLPSSEIRSAKRVVRQVDEFDPPKLLSLLGTRRDDPQGRPRAVRGGSKTTLQSFLHLQPVTGAHWGRHAPLSEVIDAHGVDIPLGGAISDHRLKEFFAELGVEYHGK